MIQAIASLEKGAAWARHTASTLAPVIAEFELFETARGVGPVGEEIADAAAELRSASYAFTAALASFATALDRARESIVG